MSDDITRRKLLQVFNYVKAYNELKNPVIINVKDYKWTMSLSDLPIHQSIKLFEASNDGDTILKVKRPIISECPKPLEKLAPWISENWREIDSNIILLETIKTEDENGNQIIVSIEDNSELKRLFEDWNDRRNSWKIQEIPARRAMDIFKRLYRLYSEIQMESETCEMIIGDGMLIWGTKNICHPVLIQEVKLIFNSEIPEFEIRYSEQSSQLYDAMLRIDGEINSSELSQCKINLEEKNYSPLDKQEVDIFFQRVVMALSPEGEFSNTSIENNKKSIPYIIRDPIIFLRKRTLGYSQAIESVINDIKSGVEIPAFIKRIVGDADISIQQMNDSETSSNYNGEDKDILFTKSANSEQLLAAKQLQRNGAVLIQGPPGTGKTHTIANIVGYLLSEGKSVLITSYSEKALRVLREKIVTPLQPLCVPLLASTESRKEMEKTINAMDDKMLQLDKETVRDEIEKLSKSRKMLVDQLNIKRENLRKERENEFRNIVINGNEYTPLEAAKFISKNSNYDWIPSPVSLESNLPVEENDLKKVYEIINRVSVDDERECLFPLPNFEKLLTIEEFSNIIDDLTPSKLRDYTSGKNLWNYSNKRHVSDLKNLLSKITEVIEKVNVKNYWELEIIEAGSPDRNEKEIWLKLIDEINSIYKYASNFKKVNIDFYPQIPDEFVTESSIEVINEILVFLTNTDRISKIKLISKQKWKKFINASTVNSKNPEKIEDFNALRMYIELQLKRNKIKNSWKRQVEAIGGPSVSEPTNEIENICRVYCNNIKSKLEWYQCEWYPLEVELKEIGFKLNDFYALREFIDPKYNDILLLKKKFTQEFPKIVENECNRIKYDIINKKIEELLKYLSDFKFSKINSDLINAIEDKSKTKYALSMNRLQGLYSIKEDINFKSEIIRKIEKYASGWAYQIKNRKTKLEFENSEDIKKAWLWRQLSDELDRRNNVDIQELQQDIAKLEVQLREKTSTLVEKKAWYIKIVNLSDSQITAMNAWKLTMRSIGAGTGRRAPALKAQARSLMTECQSAVPIWIMSISSAVENFNPRKTKFDVIIIDEASQADVMALPVMYMAKQVIIVGDDQQVSPSDVGRNLNEVQKLINTYLDGIPGRELYTGKLSIYDLAKLCGFQPVLLKEHFRCVTPIIQFSNGLSYDWGIKPLRDESTVACKPHLVPFRVESKTNTDKVNEDEAKTITSLILSCLEQPEYENKTFGVISMVGEQQAERIEALLQKNMLPIDYIKRRILCGNSAHFQGDERDIIFLSLVDTPNENGPLALRSSGQDEMFKKRYNVATSRACDQMWVVYSLSPETDLKDGDLRLRLINHAKDPYALSNEINAAAVRAESEFEKLVAEKLIFAGYKVIQQWLVGAYRIDMVVEGAGKRLAVECDGEKYHNASNLNEDIQRQAILERLGWKFARIRGSQFFRNKDMAMEAVFNHLNELEIPPEGRIVINKNVQNEKYELLERVKRRSAQIMEAWQEQDDDIIDLEKISQSNNTKTGEEEEFVSHTDAISDKNLINKNEVEPIIIKDFISQKNEDDKIPNLCSGKINQTNEKVVVNLQSRQISIFENENELNKSDFSKSTFQNINILEILKSAGLRYIDKRNNGGCLWVIGGEELSDFFSNLCGKGYQFNLTLKGGKATHHQPSWFLKSQ